VWEEGSWSGDRVTRLSGLLCLVLLGSDLALTHKIGLVFDIGFAMICIAGALAVRPRDFFRVGVLPPLLLLGCAMVASLVARTTVANPGDGYVQGVISALAHHSGALLAGYALALAVLAIRIRVATRHHTATAHSNREASPAPYLAISGTPEEKSTTVVGDGTRSPQSMTASNE
jgi:hypothetical protein